ncbi:P-loop containing nucleoside triphosphate hydrolase protein [Phellopilus nigrolimitatus]|nr:P-loop containing nucleoside triphosphate hydrolase protein [Phellopilus nigrolimitatus]
MPPIWRLVEKLQGVQTPIEHFKKLLPDHKTSALGAQQQQVSLRCHLLMLPSLLSSLPFVPPKSSTSLVSKTRARSFNSSCLRRGVSRPLRPLAATWQRTQPQIRRYAQAPGGGAGGGFPGFSGFKPQHQKGEALKEYVWTLEDCSVDLTELAKEGKLDPVIGRDEEIRRTIQILSRRTKSNPVLIGPPGVGKTAILEGLASRIVSKEVPESLQNKRVLALDLSAIMAGSGIRGAFEEKFKALIRDIEEEEGNVICFIDELHTLFNLGKAEGSIDAGQLIKPALARGLQLVGATTPDEYRKTIGKDAALERRFQPVTIDEPTVESTISILRGLKPRYEVHHGVEISDAALVTAAVYGSRYISDRFLPDKAIDLVDEAASSLRLAQESKPDELEALDRAIVTLQIELASLRNESDVFSVERRSTVEATLAEKRRQAAELTEVWQKERARIERIKDIKQRLEAAKHELEVAQREGQYEKASRLRFATIPELKNQLPTESKDAAADGASSGSPIQMLHDRVTSDDVARVVAKATGIPVQSLLKGEREKLVHMEDTLRQRVVGQDHVVKAISDAVRISRAGLQAPNRPVASFLLLGPTGVGKTELCKALAGFLFNDEQRGLININMSEYHDRHTISRLIGAAPGYVGFEEGGQLTEAVRRKPYAVILLDELEKAHKDVAMILLQILDEGSVTDSQGRKVDFKNTIICLTSNLGSDILAHSTSTAGDDGLVTAEARDLVLERTSEYFPPELLNRLDSIMVFNKLSFASNLKIVDLRLNDVAARVRDRRITLDVDEAAKSWLVKKGYSNVYGAREIARVVRTEVLFPLAQKLLNGTIRNGDTVEVRVTGEGDNLDIKGNHPVDHEIGDEASSAPSLIEGKEHN